MKRQSIKSIKKEHRRKDLRELLITGSIVVLICVLGFYVNSANAGQVICTKYENITNCQTYDDQGNQESFSSTLNSNGSGWSQDQRTQQ